MNKLGVYVFSSYTQYSISSHKSHIYDSSPACEHVDGLVQENG